MKSYETVKVEIRDSVATVSLNRPDARNAFHPSMIRDLTRAFTELSNGSSAAIVLRGEGKSFCSGADLSYMQSMAKFTIAENEADAKELYSMFWALRSCPQPVMARLHGHVMGGALGLAAACDIAAAVEGTQFSFSEVRLGLVPAVISSFVLEKMPYAAASRFMLTGEVFGNEAALDGRLIHFSGSESEVDAFLEKQIATLLSNGREAVRATKALIRKVVETDDWASKRDLTVKEIAARRVSAEGQEGLRAFLAKEPPAWKPK